jgi:hypothetical protein
MTKLAALLIGDAILGLVLFGHDLLIGPFQQFTAFVKAIHLLG